MISENGLASRSSSERPVAAHLEEAVALTLRIGDLPTFLRHAPRRLGAGAEQADDDAPVVGHGRVGEGEVCLLGVAVAMEGKREVLHVDRLAVEHAVHQAADRFADLGPGLEERAREGSRVPRTEHVRVAVVVE
jgi:hypothetical protein